ncbi:carbohydrate ABC transporter permease [Deinococcus roseus]|uniref:ABC transporter permease n=1 Tax=Deinococcus roseus TaxID=392414 RepID=A0ABQ2D2C6_9DEIO|nr:sugar ABC transporter permease [Deinococcus roseus]GGJ43029.1 ABC transporter permease [Deinococcus roseus]
MRKPFPTHIVVFLLPATLVYTVFMIFPLLSSLWLSLNTKTEAGEMFVGLANYVRLLTAPEFSQPFWNALKNNVVFFVIHMLLQNPIGLLIAVLLTRGLMGSSIYRAIIFMPTILSVVIVGFAWKLILNPAWGIAPTIMKNLGLEQYYQPWLGLESTSLTTLAFISVWQNIGIPMMLFIAALSRIPEELYEAARVDGASRWTVFWKIQLPLILPTVGIVGILTFVGNFNAFDLIYATQGALAGPNFSSDILGTFFYRTFFGNQLQPGDPYMGATVAGAMLVVILIGIVLYLWGWQRRIQNLQF